MRRLHRSHSCRRFSSLVFSLALAATVMVTAPSFAAEDATVSDAPTATASTPPAAPKKEAWKWEGSKAEENTAKGLDALVIRPLAVARVAVGAVLMIPASLFSAPSGREGFDASYEVLLEVPMEYAFDRPLGEEF